LTLAKQGVNGPLQGPIPSVDTVGFLVPSADRNTWYGRVWMTGVSAWSVACAGQADKKMNIA